MLAYIPPAFNKLCIDRKRSMVAIVSIIIGTASVILFMSAVMAFQQGADASTEEFADTVTTAGGGEYQAVTTHSTFATDHTLFSSYRSLHAVEDLTAVMTMTLALVLGAAVLLALVLVGLHFGGQALANMPKFELNERSAALQFLIESTMLTVAGSIIGIGIAFMSAGYANQILNNINLRIHVPSIALSIVLSLAIVVFLRTQRSKAV